jgi:hypothetical protein
MKRVRGISLGGLLVLVVIDIATIIPAAAAHSAVLETV